MSKERLDKIGEDSHADINFIDVSSILLTQFIILLVSKCVV
jgi:hypothetical protein